MVFWLETNRNRVITTQLTPWQGRNGDSLFNKPSYVPGGANYGCFMRILLYLLYCCKPTVPRPMYFLGWLIRDRGSYTLILNATICREYRILLGLPSASFYPKRSIHFQKFAGCAGCLKNVRTRTSRISPPILHIVSAGKILSWVLSHYCANRYGVVYLRRRHIATV